MQKIPVGKHAWMVSDAEDSTKTIVVDVKQQKVVRTLTLGNSNAQLMWPTSRGGLLVQAGSEMWLYNADLAKIATFPMAEAHSRIQFSPDASVLSIQTPSWSKTAGGKWQSNGKTDFLQADALTLIPVVNPPKVPILADSGFVQVEQSDGDVYFRPFASSERTLLTKSKAKCTARVFSLGHDKVLVGPNCSDREAKLLSLAGGPSVPINAGDLAFAQTSTSGATFVLGFQRKSRMHFLKDFNLLGDLAGTEEISELASLEAYESNSGKKIFQLTWKTAKDEPLYNSYDNSAVALSPDGLMLAMIHGNWLEVYQLPVSH